MNLKKKKYHLENKFDTHIDIITILICLIPLIFFNEDYILNNKELLSVANYISELFPNVENGAMLGKNFGLYNFIKVQIAFSLLAALVPLVYSLYSYSLIYFYSLISDKHDSEYFLEELYTKRVLCSFKIYLSIILGILLLFDIFLSGIVFQLYDGVFPPLELIYKFKITIFLYSMLYSSTLAKLSVLLIVEGVARVGKKFYSKKSSL